MAYGKEAVTYLMFAREQSSAGECSCLPVVLHCWKGPWHNLGQFVL